MALAPAPSCRPARGSELGPGFGRRPPPSRAGVFFFAAFALAATTSTARSDPWWAASGIEPDWILGLSGEPDSDSGNGSVQAGTSDGIVARRPLAIRATRRAASAGGCQDAPRLRACASVWTNSVTSSLRASGVSAGSPGEPFSGFSGSAAWTGGPLRVSAAARAGDAASRSSASATWSSSGGRLEVGFAREERGDTLLLESESGRLGLPWHDRSDSTGLSLEAPLGPLLAGVSLWTARIRARPGADLSDTVDASGWAVHSTSGFLDASLAREDREISTTGRRGTAIFHRQRLSVRRAEALLRFHRAGWASELGLRQLRAELPQGDLASPTVWWNGLASDPFAAMYSAYSDSRDYWSGELILSTWRFSLSRTWTRPAWSLEAGFRSRLWSLDCDLLRRRLQVTGLVPSVSLDTIASGDGWFAVAGPEFRFSREVGYNAARRVRRVWRGFETKQALGDQNPEARKGRKMAKSRSWLYYENAGRGRQSCRWATPEIDPPRSSQGNQPRRNCNGEPA